MKVALRRGWKLAVQLLVLMALYEVAEANRAPRWVLALWGSLGQD